MDNLAQRIADLSPEKLALFLARLEKERSSEPPAVEEPAIEARQRSDELRPLSFAQERLWFVERWHPGTSDYNVPCVLRLRGPFHPHAFEQALREVQRRHEGLRASFSEVNGSPIQKVVEKSDWAPFRVDLSGLSPGESEAEMKSLAELEFSRPFDLGKAPLFRLKFLELGRDDLALFFFLHHIVCDAWSIGVLMEEVVSLYLTFAKGEASPFEDLKFQYSDFADWQRESLRGEKLQQLLRYWTTQLDGAEATVSFRGLSADAGDPRGAEEELLIEPSLAKELKSVGQREGATLFMVLVALFGIVVRGWSDQEDLCIGTNAANRNRLETEGLIGFFINQIVLRIKVRPEDTFRKLLQQVRDTTSEAYAYQDLPYERLVAAHCPDRSQSRNPLFQVKIEYQEADRQAIEIPGLQVEGLGGESSAAHSDLLLIVSSATSGISCVLSYDSSLFPKEMIRRMGRALSWLARAVSADSDRVIDQLLAGVAKESEKSRSAERKQLALIGATKLKSIRRKTTRRQSKRRSSNV